MSYDTRYSARFELPHLIERGRAGTLTCAVYRDGALVPPVEAGSSVSIYDASGTAVVDGAAVVKAGNAATYSFAADAFTAHEYAEGWRVDWSIMHDGHGPHLFSNEAVLVRRRLYPTITDADIARRVRALDTTTATVITTATTYQPYIDEADVEIQLRLLEAGRRPWLVATPTALRQCWLMLSIALIFEDLAGRQDHYADRAAAYRQMYEDAWARASVALDYDQDGTIQPEERVSVRPGVVWLC